MPSSVSAGVFCVDKCRTSKGVTRLVWLCTGTKGFQDPAAVTILPFRFDSLTRNEIEFGYEHCGHENFVYLLADLANIVLLLGI